MSRRHRTQLEVFDGTQISLIPQHYRKRKLSEKDKEGTSVRRLKTSHMPDEDKLIYFNLSMKQHLTNNIQKFLKNEDGLHKFRTKSLLAKTLPSGIITTAEDMAGCKPNEIRAYLENYGTKKNNILWQEYVSANFNLLLEELSTAALQPIAPMAVDSLGSSVSALSVTSAQKTIEPMEIDQDLDPDYRTCTVTLNSIIRQDLSQDMKAIVYQKINTAMSHVSNFTCDFQFLVFTLMMSFRTHRFNPDIINQSVQFDLSEGFDTRAIFPLGFCLKENIPFSASPHSEEMIASEVLQSHLGGIFSKQHLEFLFSSYFGVRGATQETKNSHPLQTTLNNYVQPSTAQLFSDVNGIPRPLQVIALTQYITNFENMWKKGKIFFKTLNRLLDVLLKIHLAPKRHQAYVTFIEAKKTKSQNIRDKKLNDETNIRLGKLSRNRRRMIIRDEYYKIKKYELKYSKNPDQKWYHLASRCYERIRVYKENMAATRETRDENQDTLEPVGDILDHDPLVFEEVMTRMPVEEVLQEEDMLKESSTDATRRRMNQLKGFLKSLLLNAENRESIVEELNDQESRVCALIYNSLIAYIPPKNKRFTVSYQLPFIILANDLLRCSGYSRFQATICPMPTTKQNSMRIDSVFIYSLFCTFGDDRFRIFDFEGEIIDSQMIARSCKDAVFNSFFNISKIEKACDLNGLKFARNITVLPGMKYVKILGTKKVKSVVVTSTTKKKLNSNLPWDDIHKQQLKDDNTLRAEIIYLKQIINDAKQKLKIQASAINDRDFTQEINNFKQFWINMNNLTDYQKSINNQIYVNIQNSKKNRQDMHQLLYSIKKDLSDARYSQFTCRMAIYYRNSQHPGPTEHANHRHRRTIDKSPFIDKAENIQLPNYPEEIDRNFSFSGTDNGIVKMTETVPFNLVRFNYHLRLHNRYSPLADTQEPTGDAEELPFIPLPKPHTVNSGDIDFGGGHWRLRKKLEREKRVTGVGQMVTQIERNLAENSFSKATTVQEREQAYREQVVSREQLREFYGSRKRASAKRKVEILDYKFRNHLCTQERKKMKEGKKHLVMFIGDRGTGVGSRIKGYRRYGGTWKQQIHGQSTTTCITNEYKTSQTCVYCFHPLSHPKQKVTVKGKTIQKSINGAFICYNQACVSVRNNRNVQTRDSVSAMAIGLSGLATVLFNQSFPQFTTILSQSNTEFKHNTNSFLTRSEFRARSDAS